MSSEDHVHKEPFDTSKSFELANEEKNQIDSRNAEIKKIIDDIDNILITQNVTWSEWHRIVGAFNMRNEVVIPQITLKEIKQRYEQHT